MHAVHRQLPEIITDEHCGVGFERMAGDDESFYHLDSMTVIGVDFVDGTKLTMLSAPEGVTQLFMLAASPELTRRLFLKGINVDAMADLALESIGNSFDPMTRLDWNERIYVGKTLEITLLPGQSTSTHPLELGIVKAIRLKALP